MGHFIPCNKTIFEGKRAKLFIDLIYHYNGQPKDIVFNHGQQFISKSWKGFFEFLHVKINLETYLLFFQSRNIIAKLITKPIPIKNLQLESCLTSS